jgi:hypothetical protein
MIQVLAPRMSRGWSWVWLPLAMAALMTSTSPAQTGGARPNPAADKAKADEKAAPKQAAEAPAAAVAADEKPPTPPIEIYPDPLSKKAIEVFSPLTYVGPPLKLVGADNVLSQVQNMASGATAPDANKLKNYVEYFAAELSKRENLNAFINPTGTVPQSTARAIERAVNALIAPIPIARANNNPNNFLGIYARQLFDSSFVKLLENNLIARMDAMIVLGMVGSVANKDLDVYIGQISKPDQVMWVKQWAARGLTNAIQGAGGVERIDAAKAVQAVEALTKFLANDARTMPWPVQMRALEALGSLRSAVTNSLRGRTDAASVAMQYLVDTEIRPEVRSWAAWALGMMKYPPNENPINFPLLGDAIGRLAADLGDRIVAEYDEHAEHFARNSDEAALLTGFLLFQDYAALAGDERVKESGLIRSPHPSAAAAKSYLTGLDEKVKSVAKHAVELLRAGGVNQKAERDKLATQVADLKAYLDSKPPKDRTLIPNGPAFPAPVPQVAGARAR